MTIINYLSICDENKHNIKVDDIILCKEVARKVIGIFYNFIFLSKKSLIPLNNDFNIKLLFKDCDNIKLILDFDKINTQKSFNDFMNKR